jgi:chromosome segregation ATPase
MHDLEELRRQQQEGAGAELRALQAAHDKTNMELDDARSKNETLRRDSARPGTDLTEARDELARLAAANRELRRTVQVLEGNRQEQQEGTGGELRALQAAHDQLLLAHAQTTKELNGVRSESEALRRDLEHAGTELAEGRYELARVAAANRELRRTVLALEDIRQQRESLDARLQALEETTEALKEVRSENEALRRDSVRSGTDLAEARAELDRARSDKAELNRSLNVAEETRHELGATVLQLIEEKRALTVNTQNELQGLRCELAETIVELTKCRGEVQRLRGESDAKDLEVAQCRASMKELSTRHADLRSVVDRERQASVAANNARVQREREHQAATLLVRSLEQEIQRLEEESALLLAHARTGSEAAEAEHGRTLAVLDKMTAELRRVQAELREEKQEVWRVQAERDASTAEAQRAQAELDDANAENRRVQ